MERGAEVVEKLKGPVVSVNICFNKDNEVNYVAMRKYVDWLCREKAPVLLLTYGSSEFSMLGDEDIWRLTAEVAEIIVGRSAFIISTGWWPPRICREFLQHADKVGADTVKVQISPWLMGNAPDKGELFLSYYDEILEAAGIPLTLWCNSFGQTPVSTETIAQLAERPDVAALKNDDDPFYYYYDLIRATADYDFAVISGGQMRNFIFGYQVGSPAYLCPIAPFRPDVALKFYDLLVARDYDGAWEMVFRYEEPLMKFAGSMGWLQTLKSIFLLRGLFPNNRVSPPSKRGHNTEELQKVREFLGRVFGSIDEVSL